MSKEEEDCNVARCPCGNLYHPKTASCPKCNTPNPDICVGCGDGRK